MKHAKTIITCAALMATLTTGFTLQQGPKEEPSAKGQLQGADLLGRFVNSYTHRAMHKDFKNQSSRTAKAVLDASNKYGFDPLLVLAIIQNESRFDPQAVGMHGEIGLMQIKPETGEWIAGKAGIRWTGAHALQDPVYNIRIASAYLAMLRDTFGEENHLYLSAYNMGARNVRRLISSKTQPRVYADKTESYYSRIQAQYPSETFAKL